ncbi:MAG: serine hydrolase domain-containing protein [Kiloniellales bacterium]|nr:serine hydrolase domain-containing protein [Kiloniellales bacterium]
MALQDSLDRILQTATEAGAVPGVVAVVTDREGLTYEGGFGERALGSGVAMTPDTVVWIASMTKAVTATAAMQLVERGQLQLDAPAKEVIPYLGEVQVLEGFENSGEPQLRPPESDITLRQLLTHTAGFSYEIWNADIVRYQQATGTPMITTCEDAALTTPLLFDPGTSWDYGINIDWAGKLVEAVSGQKLGAYLAAEVFEPLGMASTGFEITEDMRARLAKIHQRGDEGFEVLDLEIPQAPEFEMGGGGLYATLGDYARFLRMILNKGEGDHGRVLEPETVEMMSVNQMGDNRVQSLKTAMPALSNDAEFFPGMPKTWGLSFMINTEAAPTGRSAGSLAWAGLANSYYWIDPAKCIAGAYATQILPFVDVRSLPLFFEFETAVYDSLGR